ncbi:conserved protein kinase [Elephant endotheliotropic herpesvirus 2]|nr:protein kinase [Elephant endotheliotropic herpesvirus 2]UEH20536.1 conserved protein kinase [Elephant endotheliotropic herpesvirus 2]
MLSRLIMAAKSQSLCSFRKYKNFFVNNAKLLKESILLNTHPDVSTQRKCHKSDQNHRRVTRTKAQKKYVSEKRHGCCAANIHLTCVEVSLSSSPSNQRSRDAGENSSLVRKRLVTEYLQQVECEEEFFKDLKLPAKHSETEKWSLVYVPQSFSDCENYCARPRKKLLGAGSYGEAYLTDSGVTKKVFSNTEIVVEAYMLSKIREVENWEIHAANLRIANSICFRHNTVSYTYFKTDLHHFNAHSVDALDNYRHTFRQLCDAICFLNMRCKLVHADVSASNILINTDEEYILHAVLGDYSLCSRHDRERAIIIMNQNNGKSLGVCQSDLQVDSTYQIIYRPLHLLFWCITMRTLSIWHLCRTAREFCVMDLCALGRVATLFALNLISYETGNSVKRGLFSVHKKYEKEKTSGHKVEYGIHVILNSLWILTCLCPNFYKDAGAAMMEKLIDVFPQHKKCLTTYTNWLREELPFRGVGTIIENKYGQDLLDFISKTSAVDDFRKPLGPLFEDLII